MKRQPFYAVRITVEDSFGSTYTRDYVRGEMRMGVDRFIAWALGDLLLTVGADRGGSWRVSNIEEVSPSAVYEQRRQLSDRIGQM